jgi:hypothetical protein
MLIKLELNWTQNLNTIRGNEALEIGSQNRPELYFMRMKKEEQKREEEQQK